MAFLIRLVTMIFTRFILLSVVGGAAGVVAVDVEVVALAGEPQLAVVLLVIDDVHLRKWHSRIISCSSNIEGYLVFYAHMQLWPGFVKSCK